VSDGITDAYNEERRTREFADYLMALATHLTVGTQDTLEKLFKAKDIVTISYSLEDRLHELEAGNKVAWARLLLTCQEDCISAFERVRHLAPWAKEHRVEGVKFDRWSEVGQFFRPYFRAAGYATNEGNGNLSGYDSYALIFSPDMTLKEIVKEAVWVGFKTTGWPGSGKVDPPPTSPLLKDRKK